MESREFNAYIMMSINNVFSISVLGIWHHFTLTQETARNVTM